jgi:hypothetical protein
MKIFTNFTSKYMKKIILSFALLVYIMLGTMSVAKATTVTYYVNITLTDTCTPSPYHGYYCVRIKLMYSGTEICQTQSCNITGSGCWAFTCVINSSASDCNYWIEFVDAVRYPSLTCYSTTGVNSPPTFCWDYLFNCSTAPSISVTL